jgi:hypothetical protein
MRAWPSSPKGDAIEFVARALSAESLDGQRVRGRVTVRFDRPLPPDVAERHATEVVEAIAAVIGEQICDGSIPFSSEDLVSRVTARARHLSARVSNIQVGALELADGSFGAQAPARSTFPPSARVERPGRASAASGVMPAMKPSAASGAPATSVSTAIRTLWPKISAAPTNMGRDRLGRLLAPALRDSAAVFLFTMLGAADPAALDRLELLEGRGKAPLLSTLRQEACACLAAILYRVLVGVTVPQAAASALAEAACREALAPDPLPAASIQRYVVSTAPLRDLAHSVAAALGTAGDTQRLFAAVSAYGTALRSDLVAAASDVKRIYDAA